MAKIDELKNLIAGTLKVNVSEIDENFSLKTGRLKTSVGSVILANIIKKVYGQKVDCRKINTFGELFVMLEGTEYEGSNTVDQYQESESDIKMESPVQEISGRLVCGIDIQEIEIFPEVDDYWSDSFYTDNFTNDEIAYCVTAASPRHSFAARWCVKEALHKCGSMYYNILFKDIQVVVRPSEIRTVEIRRGTDWQTLPFSCSLSHADNYAVGMVTGFEQ